MIAIQRLILRRRRSLMVMATLLSVGAVVLMFGVEEVRHLTSSKVGPAGGVMGLHRLLGDVLLAFGLLTATLIGTEAGTADREAGVFGDLVATGRSRISLFGARWAAAAAVTATFLLSAYLIGLVAVVALAGSAPLPNLGQVLGGAIWVMALAGVGCAPGVGLGSLTGSRSLTLVGLFVIEFMVVAMVVSLTPLHPLRSVLIESDLNRFIPTHDPSFLPVPALGALLSLGIWMLVPLGLGAWKTVTMDA